MAADRHREGRKRPPSCSLTLYRTTPIKASWRCGGGLFQITWRPPTPLFPRMREVCSFLRHSVRLLAESVAGPVRICNAGASCRDTKVAPRGRGVQVDGAGSLSRVFTATGRPQDCPRAPTRDAPTDAWGPSVAPACAPRKKKTPLRMPRGLTPFGGRVSGPQGRFLAWARIARMCVCFKRGGEIVGLGRIGGEKWCGRGDEVGRVWGWMGQGRGMGGTGE